MSETICPKKPVHLDEPVRAPRMHPADLRTLVVAILRGSFSGMPDPAADKLKTAESLADILLERIAKDAPAALELESTIAKGWKPEWPLFHPHGTGSLYLDLRNAQAMIAKLEKERDAIHRSLKSQVEEAAKATDKANAAQADARLCRGMVEAQSAMIQAALEPLGCPYPFDNHAANWAADLIQSLMKDLAEANEKS